MAIVKATKLQADASTVALLRAMCYRTKLLAERAVDTPEPLKKLAASLPAEMQAERQALMDAADALECSASMLANAYGVVQTLEKLLAEQAEGKVDQ
jgi:hypothetical protein